MLILGAWYITALAILFVFVSLFMMLVILIQKPKGGGLSGAFGGAGGSAQAAFGAKTGDVLTVVTVVFFVMFLLLAMGLTWTVRPDQNRPQGQQQQTSDPPAEQPAETTVTDTPLPPTDAGAGLLESAQTEGKVDQQINTQVDGAVDATRRNTERVDDYAPAPDAPSE